MQWMPKRSRNTRMSRADASGASANFTWWSRSSDDGGVARMYASARPTVLKNVAPYRRTSGMNCDAENRSRNAIVAPDASAGSTIAFSALPWKSGIAQYKMSSLVDHVELVAARAARHCVIRTALGAPVDPDVK